MDDASHGSPGTDLVPLTSARDLARAADAALGAAARATAIALRLGGTGRDALRAGAGVASALPGAALAERMLAAATRPLVADGVRVRRRAVAEAQRTLERVVPAIVALIDVDAIVRRVDVDGVAARIDLDALLQRVDVDTLAAAIDLDALIARIDVDAIAARIDVNAIVQQVDIDSVVEQTELGTIVARSTSGFASEALDAARTQTVGVDTLVTRLVDRVLRRRVAGPLGPPLLVDDEQDEEPAP